MDVTTALIVLLVLTTAGFGGCFYYFSNKIKQIDSLTSTHKKNLLDVEQRVAELEEAIHEVRTGSIGMGTRLKEISVVIDSVRSKQEDLQQLDPEVRLYSRAAKLVSSGATIEEIMEECELPRGEAEMLLSLHQKENI